MLLAAAKHDKAEGQRLAKLALALSCVCQGRLSRVPQKLRYVGSLTLEQGEELIEPRAVTFTLGTYESGEQRGASEMLLRGASRVLLPSPVPGEPQLPHSHTGLSDVAAHTFPA